MIFIDLFDADQKHRASRTVGKVILYVPRTRTFENIPFSPPRTTVLILKCTNNSTVQCVN